MSMIDAFMTYQFLKRLAMPFKMWPAYKMKIIDENGRILKKRKNLNSAEASAFGTFDLLVLNLKRIMGRVPGGAVLVSSLAAAMYLVKEDDEGKCTNMDVIAETLADMLETTPMFTEDAPTNSAGGGQVAGMGVPPDSLPGKPKKAPRRMPLRRISRKKSIWQV